MSTKREEAHAEERTDSPAERAEAFARHLEAVLDAAKNTQASEAVTKAAIEHLGLVVRTAP